MAAPASSSPSQNHPIQIELERQQELLARTAETIIADENRTIRRQFITRVCANVCAIIALFITLLFAYFATCKSKSASSIIATTTHKTTTIITPFDLLIASIVTGAIVTIGAIHASRTAVDLTNRNHNNNHNNNNIDYINRHNNGNATAAAPTEADNNNNNNNNNNNQPQQQNNVFRAPPTRNFAVEIVTMIAVIVVLRYYCAIVRNQKSNSPRADQQKSISTASSSSRRTILISAAIAVIEQTICVLFLFNFFDALEKLIQLLLGGRLHEFPLTFQKAATIIIAICIICIHLIVLCLIAIF